MNHGFHYNDEEYEYEEVEEEMIEPDYANDRSDTLLYYRKRVQLYMNKLMHMRSKIQHYRKVQLQFALLINKTIENQYGPIIVESPQPKPAMPPLPPISKQSRGEVIKQLLNNRPSDISKFVTDSNIVPMSMFTNKSIFDDRLRDSLMRSSPDNQITFVESLIKQIKKCGKFAYKLTPIISKFASDPLLKQQISNASADFISFFRNYQNFLSEISKLIGFENCKIIYYSSDNLSLIYPTEKYSYIMDIKDSLCGNLIRKKITQVNLPQKDPSFEVISEGPVFEEFKNALSLTFYLNKENKPGGIILLLSNSTFNDVVETKMNMVVTYITPLLKIFRSIFLEISPSHHKILKNAISSLCLADKIIPDFTKIISEACSAAECRIIQTKQNECFPELFVLPKDESIIRQSVKKNAQLSLKSIRYRPDYNKNVDDCPSLPKITSMFIAPLPDTDFIVILYNSLISNEFSPIQKSLFNYILLALPPLLHEFEMKRETSATAEKKRKNAQFYEDAFKLINPTIESINKNKLFEFINNVIKPPLKCFLFFRSSEDEAIRFPGSEVVEISLNLSESYKPNNEDDENGNYYITDKFDYHIEAGEDINAKKIMVNYLGPQRNCVCIFTTTENDFKDVLFLQNFAKILLSTVPVMYFRDTLGLCKIRQQYLRDCLKMGVDSFSKLIEADVDYEFFDPPLDDDPEIDAPLVVSIETPKGIEAALISNDTSDETKTAIITYAQWLTSALTNCTPIVDDEIFTSFFIECGVIDIFKCNKEKVQEWSSIMLKIVGNLKIENLKFVRDILNEAPWSSWYDRTQKLLIILCSFLQGIEDKWECRTDNITIERLKDCSPQSCPVLASIFGTKFGLADELPDAQISYLVHEMQKYIIGKTSKEISLMLSKVRSISMHSFKVTEANLETLGQAITFFPKIYKYTLEPKTIVDRIVNEVGDRSKKIDFFFAERIFLPMISYLSQKDERLRTINSKVRDCILEARKSLK